MGKTGVGALNRPQQIIVGLTFLAMVVLYAIYIYVQNANVFFESQFLHFEFLKDLAAHKITGKGFFTAYYEHIFPGYNLILAFNYIAFRLWGGLDAVLHAIFLIFTAGVVVWRIITDESPGQAPKVLACALVSLLLLSTTNAPQWGMALAATGGVALFTLDAALITEMLWSDSWKRAALALLLIPFANVFFLAGYGIGSAASISAVAAIHILNRHRVSPQAVAIFATLIISVLIYAALAVTYGKLTANHPTALIDNIGNIVQFGVLMTGSSVLGKALFEQTNLIFPYYVIGSILVVLTLCSWIDALRNPTRGKMFFFALSMYSAANIVAVSFFRYRNGPEGAMGQWYNAQTHFIAVAAVYFIATKGQGIGSRLRGLGYAVIGIILFAALSGYVCDWRKGMYVKEYKEKFIAQAPMILAFPDTISDKHDTHQTMLWDYTTVKPTIDFLFAHKLWIFRTNDARASGLDHDGWVESGRVVSVICPTGSTSLKFKMWRPADWTSSSITVNKPSGEETVLVADKMMEIDLVGGIPAVTLDTRDETKSHPVSSSSDPRKLVAIVSNFQCQVALQ